MAREQLTERHLTADRELSGCCSLAPCVCMRESRALPASCSSRSFPLLSSPAILPVSCAKDPVIITMKELANCHRAKGQIQLIFGPMFSGKT